MQYAPTEYIIDNPVKWQNDELNGSNENIAMESQAGYEDTSQAGTGTTGFQPNVPVPVLQPPLKIEPLK